MLLCNNSLGLKTVYANGLQELSQDVVHEDIIDDNEEIEVVEDTNFEIQTQDENKDNGLQDNNEEEKETEEEFKSDEKENLDLGSTINKNSVKDDVLNIKEELIIEDKKEMTMSAVAREKSVFNGLGDSAFDGNFDTYVTLNNNRDITWNNNLDNRKVSISAKMSTYYNEAYIKVKNASGEYLDFIDLDTKNFVQYMLITGSDIKEYNISMPKGAATIEIIPIGNAGVRVYEVFSNDNENIPGIVSNVSSTENAHGIEMTWENPNDNDCVTNIYRNGMFIAQVEGNSYTDESLLSNEEYEYSFYRMNSDGNVGDKVIYKAKTISDKVNFRFSDNRENSRYMFDHNKNTSVSVRGKYNVTWDGDMSNRAISMTYTGNNSSYSSYVAFLNENGEKIDFLDINTNRWVKSLPTNNHRTETLKMVVPDGAVSMEVYMEYGSTIYEIEHFDDLTIPKNVSNVKTEIDKRNVILSWDKPISDDARKVLVFRNNVLVAESEVDGIVEEKHLLSNKEYVYKIYTQDSTGNLSNPLEKVVVTKSDNIEFRGIEHDNGISKVFDEDLSTNYRFSGKKNVTWNGDLDGRTIRVKSEQAASYCPSTLYVKDENGNKIEFIDKQTDSVVTSMEIADDSGLNSNRTDKYFVMPSGAKSIEIEANTNGIWLYEILVNQSSEEIEEEVNDGIEHIEVDESTTEEDIYEMIVSIILDSDVTVEIKDFKNDKGTLSAVIHIDKGGNISEIPLNKTYTPKEEPLNEEEVKEHVNKVISGIVVNESTTKEDILKDINIDGANVSIENFVNSGGILSGHIVVSKGEITVTVPFEQKYEITQKPSKPNNPGNSSGDKDESSKIELPSDENGIKNVFEDVIKNISLDEKTTINDIIANIDSKVNVGNASIIIKDFTNKNGHATGVIVVNKDGVNIQIPFDKEYSVKDVVNGDSGNDENNSNGNGAGSISSDVPMGTIKDVVKELINSITVNSETTKEDIIKFIKNKLNINLNVSIKDYSNYNGHIMGVVLIDINGQIIKIPFFDKYSNIETLPDTSGNALMSMILNGVAILTGFYIIKKNQLIDKDDSCNI